MKNLEESMEDFVNEAHELSHPIEMENNRMMRSSAAEFTKYLTRKAEESKPQNFTERGVQPISTSMPVQEAKAEVLTAEIIKQLEDALPELEKMIQKTSGVKAKMNVEAQPRDPNGVRVFSDSLYKQLSPIGKTAFSDINIEFWGGSYIPKAKGENARIWFNPKLSYSHPSGGSNGTEFIWQGINYDVDDNKWIYGRKN